MRILVTTNAAMGHLAPLVPSIRALLRAGHDVRVGCPARFAATVASAGIEVLACREEPVTATVPPPPEDRERRLEWAVTVSWPSEARPWVSDLLDQAESWRPDVVVVEPVEHAGRVVAAVLGVPLVEHGWGFTLPAGMTEAGSLGLLDLYDSEGVTPVAPALSIDLGAASVQARDIGQVTRYRYSPWSLPGQSLPDPDGRSRVLVTLGTFDNPDAARRIRVAVTAAHNCGAQVIAVLGNPDRRSTEEFPAGTAIVDWIDMPEAVAGCDLVVHHGGAGTSWATLASGRPAVITPQVGDQFRNSECLVRAGAALAVDPSEPDTGVLGRTIERVLTAGQFTVRAAQIATENATLPDPARLATDITSLA